MPASRKRKRKRSDLEEYCSYLEKRVHQLTEQVRELEDRVQRLQAGHGFSAPVQREPPSTVQSQPPAPIRSQPPTTVHCQPSTQLSSALIVFRAGSPVTKSSTKSPTKSQSRLSEFLKQIPKDEAQWTHRRKLVNHFTLEQLIDTFRLLTRMTHSSSCSLGTGDRPGREASILDILEDYRQFAGALGVHKVYATQMSYYSALLFTCLSIVALKAGAKKGDVDEHVKKFLSDQQKTSSAGSDYITQIRRGCLWVLARMKELYSKGLKHRAWEVFILCGPSVHTYKFFTKEAEEFTDKVAICKPPAGEVQADVPFDIAFMARFILGDRCSLDHINDALGTELREETFEMQVGALWKIIQSQRKITPLPPSRKRRRKRRRVSTDDEETGSSSAEASSDEDADSTSSIATTDSTQFDDDTETLGKVGMTAIGEHPERADCWEAERAVGPDVDAFSSPDSSTSGYSDSLITHPTTVVDGRILDDQAVEPGTSVDDRPIYMSYVADLLSPVSVPDLNFFDLQ